MRIPATLLCMLLAGTCLAGCTGTPPGASYTVDSSGRLSVMCAPVTVTEEILFTNATFTESRIVLHTRDGNVVAYLGSPQKPAAAAVYAPGAGESLAAHEDRMVRYGAAGYAFLFADLRGNGGDTPGAPFSQQLVQEDYNKFSRSEWPQYYLTVCDLLSARRYLAGRYGVPVYAMGSSNGGRYAAIAAAVDPAFAGYIGISTADWGIRDSVARQGITGDPARFAASLEPSTYIASISPRPVWIFHAPADSIIPISGGKDLYEKAGEPKTFSGFAGSHGINSDVDHQILSSWAQIYGTRG